MYFVIAAQLDCSTILRMEWSIRIPGEVQRLFPFVSCNDLGWSTEKQRFLEDRPNFLWGFHPLALCFCPLELISLNNWQGPWVNFSSISFSVSSQIKYGRRSPDPTDLCILFAVVWYKAIGNGFLTGSWIHSLHHHLLAFGWGHMTSFHWLSRGRNVTPL